MDDKLRLVVGKSAFDGREIEQVKVGARQRPCVPERRKLWRRLDEMASNQSICAGDPGQFHSRILPVGKPFANAHLIG